MSLDPLLTSRLILAQREITSTRAKEKRQNAIGKQEICRNEERVSTELKGESSPRGPDNSSNDESNYESNKWKHDQNPNQIGATAKLKGLTTSQDRAYVFNNDPGDTASPEGTGGPRKGQICPRSTATPRSAVRSASQRRDYARSQQDRYGPFEAQRPP
jgi:hypothetical protein